MWCRSILQMLRKPREWDLSRPPIMCIALCFVVSFEDSDLYVDIKKIRHFHVNFHTLTRY